MTEDLHDEVVFVGRPSSRQRRVYHTNENCPRLRNTNPREEDQLLGDWIECEWCSGDVETTNGDRPYLAHRLLGGGDDAT